ncbi:hypothetical protein ACFFIF_05425 [Vagococcus entomophilus]|nr:hypothetical protein [Vagococcus entomophilus]
MTKKKQSEDLLDKLAKVGMKMKYGIKMAWKDRQVDLVATLF